MIFFRENALFSCLKIVISQNFFVLKAEARLAARRQARYEARNIRLKEIEKKQKEEEENQANHTNHNHVPHHPGKSD